VTKATWLITGLQIASQIPVGSDSICPSLVGQQCQPPPDQAAIAGSIRPSAAQSTVAENLVGQPAERRSDRGQRLLSAIGAMGRPVPITQLTSHGDNVSLGTYLYQIDFAHIKI
jgi:hypothetical protein